MYLLKKVFSKLKGLSKSVTGNSLIISTKIIKKPVKIEGRIRGKIILKRLFSKDTPCSLPASSKFGEIL